METQRENFAIQRAIVMAQLEEMLEKTKKIEAHLLQHGSPQVMAYKFYRPSIETQEMQPSKKS
jgi:hypothetical protein